MDRAAGRDRHDEVVETGSLVSAVGQLRLSGERKNPAGALRSSYLTRSSDDNEAADR